MKTKAPKAQMQNHEHNQEPVRFQGESTVNGPYGENTENACHSQNPDLGGCQHRDRQEQEAHRTENPGFLSVVDLGWCIHRGTCAYSRCRRQERLRVPLGCGASPELVHQDGPDRILEVLAAG